MNEMDPSPRPAQDTKHLAVLSYPFLDARFSLRQLDDGQANGTALWLGAQCLSLYLPSLLSSPRTHHTNPRPAALDLGSGIGLTALALRSLGCDVLATDTEQVISSVLRTNILNNPPPSTASPGAIQIRELDWTISPRDWDWSHPSAIASRSPRAHPSSADSHAISTAPNASLRPPFDLIVSSDTIYSPALVTPLLRTLHAVSTQSIAAGASRPPPVYLCIERRDSAVIDRALTEASTVWGFAVEHVPHRKLAKAMAKGGLRWARDDWEGVELWKLVLKRSSFPEPDLV